MSDRQACSAPCLCRSNGLIYRSWCKSRLARLRLAPGKTNNTRRCSVWPRINHVTSVTGGLANAARAKRIFAGKRLAAAAGGKHQDVIVIATVGSEPPVSLLMATFEFAVAAPSMY